MPLVFVHGVNTRKGTTPKEENIYNNRFEYFKQQFREITFKKRISDLKVYTPYWGDLGVKFARNLLCIPHGNLQTLGLGSPETAAVEEITLAHLDGELGLDDEVKNRPILTLARRRGLRPAVNLLFAGASTAPLISMLDKGQHKSPEAARLALAAEEYSEKNGNPDWLNSINNDDEFINFLLKEIHPSDLIHEGIQTLSIGSTLSNWLKNAAIAVKSATGKIMSVATGAVVGSIGGVVVGAAVGGGKDSGRQSFMLASRYIRPTASTFIARFFGDVFKYMENRDEIIKKVLQDIDDAIKERDKLDSEDKELILVGHSFGGIILFDILTHFRPNIVCDLLVTVGSQVALFAEIGLFANQEPLNLAFQANKPAPRPNNIKRWINVFDETDYVGFGVTDVFTGAKDFSFDADAYPILSHGAYFDTPNFYVRLRERAEDAFANGTDS